MSEDEFSIEYVMKLMAHAQIQRAERLARELHERGYDITTLDLLDVLAKESLRLEPMLEALGNVAATAYLEALMPDE